MAEPYDTLAAKLNEQLVGDGKPFFKIVLADRLTELESMADVVGDKPTLYILPLARTSDPNRTGAGRISQTIRNTISFFIVADLARYEEAGDSYVDYYNALQTAILGTPLPPNNAVLTYIRGGFAEVAEDSRVFVWEEQYAYLQEAKSA